MPSQDARTSPARSPRRSFRIPPRVSPRKPRKVPLTLWTKGFGKSSDQSQRDTIRRSLQDNSGLGGDSQKSTTQEAADKAGRVKDSNSEGGTSGSILDSAKKMVGMDNK